MKQEARYRIFHYDIFVLLTVVLVVVAIHVVDGLRLYPESYYARDSYVRNLVSKYKYKILLNNMSVYDSLVDYSIRYSDYIYDPDSVYSFCKMLGKSLEGMEAVAVVPSRDLYKTKDYFIPVYSKYISGEAFNGVGLKVVDQIYNYYNWNKARLHPDGSLDLISDPFKIRIKDSTLHVSLLCLPVIENDYDVSLTIVVAFSLDDLGQYVRQLDTFKEGNLYVVSNTDKFFVHPDTSKIGEPSRSYLSECYGPAALEILDSSLMDYSKVYSRNDGVNMMYAVTSNSSLWTLFYSVPTDEVLSPMRNDIIFISIVAIIGVVIIILVCAYNIKWASDHRARQSAIERDLEIAANIQKRLLKKPSLSFHGVDVDIRHKSAKTVGGDLYYLRQIDEDRLVFCVGDVSGKGVPASILMSGAVTLLDVFVRQYQSPSEICSCLNAELSEDNNDFNFVTLFLSVLDTRTGLMKYCNAGHDEPIYMGRYLKTSDNMPVGADPSQQFTEGEIQLEDGSYLVLYTDGITEAQGSQNRFYGTERFLNSVSNAPKSSAALMNDHILSDLHEFVAHHEQSDDITLLTLQFSRK